MSFGGSSGGTVRYALLVDSAQGERSLSTFKNSLTQLGAGTTQIQSKIQGFTAQLSKQSQAFTAGINPIKQQGAALNNLSNNLKTQSTQMTTLGSKVKDSASKFAGFATGLSATTSGFLQLGAGARDYGDAQIAVDKAQRKLSLSQEALNKAQDKLEGLQKKGIKSGKEYAQAQLDVKQAQEGLAISTQLVGERQEDMFDAQTQFATSVIPITLGAVGTLGSAFKDLGGPKGMGGLVDKFKGLGGASGVLKGGMGGLLGVLGPLGLGLGVLAVSVLYAKSTFDSMQKAVADIKVAEKIDDITKSVEGMNKGFNDMKANPGIGSLKEIADLLTLPSGAAGLRNTIVDQVKNAAIQSRILASEEGKLAKVHEALAASIGKLKAANLSRDKSDNQAALTNMLLNRHEALRIRTLMEVTTATEQYTQSGGEMEDALKKMGPSILLIDKNTADLNTALVAGFAAIQKGDPIVQGFGATLEELKAKFESLNKTKKDFGDFASADVTQFNNLLKNWGGGITNVTDKTRKLAEESQFVAKVNELAWGAPASSRFANFTTFGTKAYQEIQDKATKAADEAKKKWDETQAAFKKGLVDAQTNIKGVFKIDSNADKILKNLIKALPSKAEKEIKLQLKFGQSVDDNKKAFNDLMFEATQVSDKTADASAKQIIETIDKKFKGAKGQFAGLRTALQTAIADPNTPEALKTLLMNFKWDSVGNTIGSKVNQGVTDFFGHGAGLDFGEGGGAGLVVPIAPPVIPAPNTAALDKGITAVKTNLESISKTIPKATINIDEGLGKMGEMKRGWDKVAGQMSKQIPKLTVNADKALDMIGELKRGWDKAAGQIEKKVPKITVNADQALDMIGEVKRGMDSIKSKSVDIHVGLDGAGASKFDSGGGGSKGGTSISSKGDTSTMFVQSSRAMSGSGSGDVTNVYFRIDGNDIVNTKELKRQIKRDMGTNRYTLGA